MESPTLAQAPYGLKRQISFDTAENRLKIHLVFPTQFSLSETKFALFILYDSVRRKICCYIGATGRSKADAFQDRQADRAQI